ncbi:MAG: holo-ACP synthase [Bacteroidota bacterium]
MTSAETSKIGFTVGNDLIYLPNFQASLTAPFIRRVYTEEEKSYCQSFQNALLRYASTFAAKEAVYKALKQQHEQLSIPWKKIAIERSKLAGKPSVQLSIPDLPPPDISLSISHDGDYVWAVVLISTK